MFWSVTRKIPIVIGQRFGRWTVTGEAPSTAWARRVAVRCDCGTETMATFKNLRRGTSVSCGCYKDEVAKRVNTKHGASGGWKGRGTSEYEIWSAMKARCLNQRSRAWRYYGGRGITVCNRWLDFANFLADMGPRPSPKHSIDRIDVNGNYEPGNVRWTTWKVQMRNTRRNKVSLETIESLHARLVAGSSMREAAEAEGLPWKRAYQAHYGVYGRSPGRREKTGPKPRGRAA